MTVQADDFPSGDTVGFMNVLVQADSAEAAESKVRTYFATFNWHIVQTENSKVIEPNFVADEEEFAEMIERARAHPDPIICGTFHSYKIN
jgi:hypothetical protein